MIPIRDIDHVVIRAKDIEAMVAFYRDVLGCPLEKVQEEFGLWQLRAGTSLIDLVDAGDRGPPPAGDGRNMDHVCLHVEPWDAAAIAAHLEAHGVEPGAVKPRYGARGYGPSIYIRDPEGNRVELKGPAE